MNHQTPRLRLRMAAFLYEGVLLFGVVMLFGLIYSISTGQRHALFAHDGMQIAMFLSLGLYFWWFWTHGGQTLAMKTWRIRLVLASGEPISHARAVLRYLACWIWFMPGLWLAYFYKTADGTSSGLRMLALPLLWIVGYALLSFVQPQRQFWHDVLCGTRLVEVPRAGSRTQT